MDRQTDGPMDRWTYRQTVRQMDWWKDDRQADGLVEKRQTDIGGVFFLGTTFP